MDADGVCLEGEGWLDGDACDHVSDQAKDVARKEVARKEVDVTMSDDHHAVGAGNTAQAQLAAEPCHGVETRARHGAEGHPA